MLISRNISSIVVLLICASLTQIGTAAEPEARATLEKSNAAPTLIERIDDARATLKQTSGPAREAELVSFATRIKEYVQSQPEKSVATAHLRGEALGSYIEAADIALVSGLTRYTREIAELAVELNDRALLDYQFERFLQNHNHEKGMYLARIDYAGALAQFSDSRAAAYFTEAVGMREPKDGVEANVRYAQYLIDSGDPAAALPLLEKYRPAVSTDTRKVYVGINLMRQKLVHSLGLDTTAVDEEMSRIRRAAAGAFGVGPIPKISGRIASAPENVLGLPEAHAVYFSHTNATDDSRGPNANSWMLMPGGRYWARMAVNGGEVLYNEARGEPEAGRFAVAWVIRNRALINNNGCDFYHGAEGHGGTNACRLATPPGPQSRLYSDAYKRYSCVIHGGTTTVGALHKQMKDNHISPTTLAPTGLIDEFAWVINGWVPDETSANTPSGTYKPPLPPGYPWNNINGANPAGAQEFKSINYCAERAYCKQRLGNVGGNLTDPGNLCPNNGPPTTDNYFWGRKP